MDIFDSIRSGADKAAKKAGDYSDIAKLTLKLKNEKAKLKVMFYELGAAIYNADDHDAEGEIKNKMYPEIIEKQEYIAKLTHMLDTKTGAVRCKSCKAKIKANMAYCPVCGTKQHDEPKKEETRFVDITDEYFADQK